MLGLAICLFRNSFLGTVIVNLPVHIASSIPPRLLGQHDVTLPARLPLDLAGRLGAAAADVAADKEHHEQVGQRREVEHVQPDGESLAAGGDAWLGDENGLGLLLGR